jgi:pyridoxal phosphate enzyme (YggS family)
MKEQIDKINALLQGTSCKLVAVSKTKPVEAILAAYQAGVRRFGENKVQEMSKKQLLLPKDIEWHMIGHLQTNKVKYIASFVSLIHSIDSIKLLEEVNKRAAQNNRVIDCLLQIHIAKEDTKFGLDYHEAEALLQLPTFSQLKNIRIVGVMGMASNTEDNDLIRREFRALKQFYDKIKQQYSGENILFSEISMGMSGDYQIAIAEGSTLIRVGSAIFGSR